MLNNPSLTFEEWCKERDISGNFQEALEYQILLDNDASFLTFNFDALSEAECAKSWNKVLDRVLSRINV